MSSSAPAPAHMDMPVGGSFGTFMAEDGAEIRYALWPREDARGTVILQGGFSEFIEKHYETTQDLLDRGFAVAAMDWRSQGLSQRHVPDRHKVFVKSFDLYVSDLHQFIDTIVTRQLPGPYVLVAHSMGGHLALRYLHDYRDTVKAAVLSAPMIAIGFPLGLECVAKLTTRYAMWRGRDTEFAVGQGPYGEKRRRFEGNKLTSDPVRFRQGHDHIDLNPDLAIGGPTNRWLAEAFVSTEKFREVNYLKAFTTPICLVQAGDEGIVDNAAQTRFAARVPACELHRIEGAKHELLKERDELRNQFWAHFDRFVTRFNI